MKCIRSVLIDIAVEHGGPANGAPVILLHGWPDAPRGWEPVARRLEADGHRRIIPFLRGSEPTRFLSKHSSREYQAKGLKPDADTGLMMDALDGLLLTRLSNQSPRTDTKEKQP